ncbi:hypothetical protein Tco_0936079 [Tanacetum coccineum]
MGKEKIVRNKIAEEKQPMKLQKESSSQWKRKSSKFLHDTMLLRGKLNLVAVSQRIGPSETDPPNQESIKKFSMMTYLKHVGIQHSELESKKFEDIQANSSMERIQAGILIERSPMNRIKGEENKRKRKHAPDEDKEVDYEILDKKYPIIDWKTKNLGTKPQFDKSKKSEEINMNVVTRSNGQKRCFSTLIRVLSVHKNWLVQDQTVLGKDYSNLLIADSLLKTIWFINDQYEELSIPEQMATGKGTSNPLMAGSLPKTTKPT